jgi:hypothetical protein
MSINEQRYQKIANAFDLSPLDIENQYILALKTRLGISPMLMRRLIIDAIGILRIMIDDIDRHRINKNERIQRVKQRLHELELCKTLFDYHC